MCGLPRLCRRLSLEIGAVMIMLTRLRDGDAIESDVTLTEQRVEEIICHAREVRKFHIFSAAYMIGC